MNLSKILAMENAKKRDPVAHNDLLIRHIEKLRSIPNYRNSTIVFVPESNYAFEGYRLALELKRQATNNDVSLSNICIMDEDDCRPGIRTSDNLKALMAITTRMRLEAKAIRFHKSFFTCDEDKNEVQLKKDFCDQLKNYCEITIPNKDPFQAPRIKYSGKGGYGSDDSVIAIGINILMHGRFLQSPKYEKYRRR